MLIQRLKIVTITAALTLAIGAIVALQLPAQSHAAAACTRLASSSGNDSAAGMPPRPGAPSPSCSRACNRATSPVRGRADVRLGELPALAHDRQRHPAVGTGTPATLIGLFVVSGAGSTVTGLNLDGQTTSRSPATPPRLRARPGWFIAGNNVSIIGNNISKLGTRRQSASRSASAGSRAVLIHSATGIHGCGSCR